MHHHHYINPLIHAHATATVNPIMYFVVIGFAILVMYVGAKVWNFAMGFLSHLYYKVMDE